MRKLVPIFVFMVLMSSIGYAQRSPVTQNYRKFDRKLVHFGFMLGVNTSDFSVQYKPNMLNDYNVYSISNKSQPGFQLGIISSLKLGTPLLRLRFIPSLSFQERVLNYTFLSEDQDKDFDTYEERVGSTNLDFPLLLKFRTARYNNFAAYIIGGAQYTLDLQSKEKSAQKYGDPFIKIYRDDFQAQIGAGADFFLPFFKFGIEIKLSHGIKNALIQDNTRLSNPVNALYNRVWWISLTFEG
ncbi:porin family protein [Brumimicrobium sp.]|uniref:type IX secretion/gliding motility protein PorT/SprT n=1 Tax=Brumimicrobium sp. TaxID=2029867 RepID=UPI00261197B8|nr:porin family protein [uncultured Brumimicrobium sp.]